MEHIFYPIFLPVNLAVFETIEQELWQSTHRSRLAYFLSYFGSWFTLVTLIFMNMLVAIIHDKIQLQESPLADKGPIHDQSCCATFRVVQHDWPCMLLIDLIVNGQTCVAQNNFTQHDWSWMGRNRECWSMGRFKCTPFSGPYVIPNRLNTIDIGFALLKHSGYYMYHKYFCLLGCSNLYPGRLLVTFRRNLQPPSLV
jgi:hypothetical protein